MSWGHYVCSTLPDAVASTAASLARFSSLVLLLPLDTVLIFAVWTVRMEMDLRRNSYWRYRSHLHSRTDSRSLSAKWTRRRLTKRCKPTADTRRSPIPVPQTPSAFHPRAQRNAFHRHDARQQSRPFARQNPRLRPSPTPTRFLEIVRDDLPVLQSLVQRWSGVDGTERKESGDQWEDRRCFSAQRVNPVASTPKSK